MTDLDIHLRTYRVRKLVAQSRCPVCGAGIVSGGGGIAFARNTYACGAAFGIDAEGNIAADLVCHRPSYIAAAELNHEAAKDAAGGVA